MTVMSHMTRDIRDFLLGLLSIPHMSLPVGLSPGDEGYDLWWRGQEVVGRGAFGHRQLRFSGYGYSILH